LYADDSLLKMIFWEEFVSMYSCLQKQNTKNPQKTQNGSDTER